MQMSGGGDGIGSDLRAGYDRRLAELRSRFEQDSGGVAFIEGRAAAADRLIEGLWAREVREGAFPGCWGDAGGAGRVWAAAVVSVFRCGSAVLYGEGCWPRSHGSAPADLPGLVGWRAAGFGVHAEAE